MSDKQFGELRPSASLNHNQEDRHAGHLQSLSPSRKAPCLSVPLTPGYPARVAAPAARVRPASSVGEGGTRGRGMAHS